MKRLLKRLLSVFLCLTLSASFAALCFESSAEEDFVTVYVRGSTNIYRFNEDGSKTALLEDRKAVVNAILKELPYLTAVQSLGLHEVFSERVLEILKPFFDGYRPSLVDGSVPENSRVDWYWTRETIEDVLSRQTYVEYWLDQRLSPFAQAADLNDFIETVKEVSGHQKFYLYARCLGPVAALTYLHEYQRPKNYEDILGLQLSYTTHNGMASTDGAYTGTMHIPKEGMQYWLKVKAETALDGEVPNEIAPLIFDLIECVAKSLGVKLTVDWLNWLYEDYKTILIRPVILEYYGRCMNYLACVNARFDEMMDYLYPTAQDRETYGFIIGEVTRYHETVYPDINPMLQELMDQGKTVLIMADYGGQQYPTTPESEYLGDFQVGTSAMSFGATTSKIWETLDSSYIAEREALGFGQYISPNKKVDASTCAFPDITFFISNFDHEWPGKYAGCELELLRRPQFNIHSDENVPQFLYWDRENQELLPLSSVLPQLKEPALPQSFFEKVAALFRALIERLKTMFAF